MQLKINAQILRDSLNKMLSVVDKKISRPLLTNCLFEAKNNSLTIVATDLEVSAKLICPAVISEEGVFCINAKNIFDIVRELPDEEITFSSDNAKNVLKLVCRNIDYSLLITNAEEYPDINFASESNTFHLHAKQLLECINRVSYAISTDETRPFLNGMFFQVINSSLRTVAVDGYRLALLDIEDFNGPEDFLTDGIIIPRKGIGEVKKLAETYPHSDIRFALDDSFIYISCEDYYVSVRLIAREFPKYQAHIPTKTKYSMNVDRSALIKAIKRIRILANEKTNGVKLNISNNKLTISANHSIIGDAFEIVDVNYTGDEMSIGFNAKYLLDTLSVLPDSEVIFEFNSELHPVVVKSEELPQYLGILMPLRL